MFSFISTDYAILIFGAYVLFELHRITDRLTQITAALKNIEITSAVVAENSAWLERLDQRLELIEMHSDTSNDWLRHIVDPPEPRYREP